MLHFYFLILYSWFLVIYYLYFSFYFMCHVNVFFFVVVFYHFFNFHFSIVSHLMVVSFLLSFAIPMLIVIPALTKACKCHSWFGYRANLEMCDILYVILFKPAHIRRFTLEDLYINPLNCRFILVWNIHVSDICCDTKERLMIPAFYKINPSVGFQSFQGCNVRKSNPLWWCVAVNNGIITW